MTMLAVNTGTMYMMASKVVDSEFPFRSNQGSVLVVSYTSTTFIVQSFTTSLINQIPLINSASSNTKHYKSVTYSSKAQGEGKTKASLSMSAIITKY